MVSISGNGRSGSFANIVRVMVVRGVVDRLVPPVPAPDVLWAFVMSFRIRAYCVVRQVIGNRLDGCVQVHFLVPLCLLERVDH